MGQGSPGPVSEAEEILRFIVSPGDVDEDGHVFQTAFQDAYRNGLSMFRSSATAEHIEALAIDRLTVKPGSKPRQVLFLLSAKCSEVRQLTHSSVDGPLFCVYDETVPRKFDDDAPHVPTHVTVLQRPPPPKTDARKPAMRDANGALHGLLTQNKIDVGAFKGGLFEALNQRSAAGEFVR